MQSHRSNCLGSDWADGNNKILIVAAVRPPVNEIRLRTLYGTIAFRRVENRSTTKG